MPWYRVGAQWLCGTQKGDGRWGDMAADPKQGGFATGPEIDTAFALLFLLCASEAYTPVSPRPVDSKRSPRGPASRR